MISANTACLLVNAKNAMTAGDGVSNIERCGCRCDSFLLLARIYSRQEKKETPPGARMIIATPSIPGHVGEASTHSSFGRYACNLVHPPLESSSWALLLMKAESRTRYKDSARLEFGVKVSAHLLASSCSQWHTSRRAYAQ